MRQTHVNLSRFSVWVSELESNAQEDTKKGFVKEFEASWPAPLLNLHMVTTCNSCCNAALHHQVWFLLIYQYYLSLFAVYMLQFLPDHLLEISQTLCIDCHSFRSSVHISVRPCTFFRQKTPKTKYLQRCVILTQVSCLCCFLQALSHQELNELPRRNDGKTVSNRPKNRYRNILPCEKHVYDILVVT